jgi:hypothetical protein
VVSVQPLIEVTSFTKEIVGDPQASVAVTAAMFGAGTVALQPKVISDGQVMDGGVRSTVHVTVLIAVAELPQPSEAINVLTSEAAHAAEITGPSVNVTIGIPHAAVAVAEPSAAVISEAEGLQPRANVAGLTIIVGGLGAFVQVTVLVVAAELPQASIAINVLVCEAEQLVVVTLPSVKEMVGIPQASEAVAVPRAAAISEAAGLQPSDVAVPEAVIVGGVTSTVLVIVCVHTAELPQASTAR